MTNMPEATYRPYANAAERANAMIRRIDAGFFLREVAADFGLTRERVRQIYTGVTGHGVPHKQTKPDRSTVKTRQFWAFATVQDDGCWVWTGSTDPSGYGRFAIAGQQYAHRAAHVLVKGPIPKGLTIDHLCRNTHCVNPTHLEAVTQRENTMRSPIAVAAINARKTHCPQGHPYTAENTYRSPKKGGRTCRLCHRAQSARNNAARRAARREVAA